MYAFNSIVLVAAFAIAQGIERLAEETGGDTSADHAFFLQRPSALNAKPAERTADSTQPHVIGLRRESVPVYRKGKVASFKTSYSGVLRVGTPAQEFRVVFDTGSGHIVLPAAECKSEACLMPGRHLFNMGASSTAAAINSDGSIVPEGELCDQVTIGFGTGKITGEFTRDKVCFGATNDRTGENEENIELSTFSNGGIPSDAVVLAQDAAGTHSSELCVEMDIVLAVEMSSQPFKTFRFDGILGLGLDGLALNKNFSAFDTLIRGGLGGAPHFGVFLTEGEEGEVSEIALGGHDSRRLLEPLSWVNVAMPEHGHWQVEIVAIRINGHELDVCKDGSCRGVVDTGTSHLGVPAPFDKEVGDLLTMDAGDTLDCRLANAPSIEVEVPGYKMTLEAFNYMRRLPLREGVQVTSPKGITLSDDASNSVDASANAPSAKANFSTGNADGEPKRFCKPRLMPVKLPAPLGPKLFIFGEPVLHRYYTVFDWEQRKVGFGLANNHRNTMDPATIVNRQGSLPKEVDVLLMQESVHVTPAQSRSRVEDGQEEATFVQVKVLLRAKVKKQAPCSHSKTF